MSFAARNVKKGHLKKSQSQEKGLGKGEGETQPASSAVSASGGCQKQLVGLVQVQALHRLKGCQRWIMPR